MTSMSVLTPSYAPDLELCRDLHASVLRWGPDDLVHHIVVPKADFSLFEDLRGPRCQIWPVDAFLPRHITRVPTRNIWINARRPWPPIRGWIMQQVVKLSAASLLEEEVLLFVDSDIEFVRPFSVETYQRNGRLMLHRRPDAVHEAMPNHIRWHDSARRLIGRPPQTSPLPDYIAAPNAWDRRTALGLLQRIAEVSGRPWIDTVCATVHLSEFMLYGVYVEEVVDRFTETETTPILLCHNYWETIPLDEAAAHAFMRNIGKDDVAVMISAKSSTPRAVRRAAIDALSR